MRILLVEDDPILGDGLSTAFWRESYTVDWVKDGRQALQAIETEDFGLVVLDLGLPGMDGLDVLKRVRAAGLTVPILILTARDAITDRVAGLDLGADDYLVKPFDIAELYARVRSLIRRSLGRARPTLAKGGVEIDPAKKTVLWKSEQIDLSGKEYAVLLYLVENSGRPVSRAKLEEQLYGWDHAVDSNALEVHIHNLRKKLSSQVIKTIRGLGYQFNGSPSE